MLFSKATIPVGILYLIILFNLTGCVAAEFLATEDIALMEGAGLRVTASEIAVTDEALALGRLSRVRLMARPLQPSILYTEEAGMQRQFAELLDESTIRSVRSGRVLTLPFRVFRVGRYASAELRAGPGTTYGIFKTIPKDRMVFVIDEIKDWYKINSNGIIGWVAAASLVSGSSAENLHQPKITYKKIDCYHCSGTGEVSCSSCNKSGVENCPSCKGQGKHKCSHCNGTGHNKCLICKGQNSSGCPSCHGTGYLGCGACNAKGYFDCSICHSTGKIPCAICDGTLQTKCYYCFGTKSILERNDK